MPEREQWAIHKRALACYRYFVDKGISPLGEEPRAFFSRLTSPIFICLQRRANSDSSPVHKLPVSPRCASHGYYNLYMPACAVTTEKG